jgi:hypothetical protein
MEGSKMGQDSGDHVGLDPESVAEQALQERPTTRDNIIQPEPLDTTGEDPYRLREPIADLMGDVSDGRYLQSDQPMTAWNAVGSYIRRRRGESVSAEKHGFKKTRHWRANRQYARGKEMDRQLLEEYTFPSIALLSLRVSPGEKSRLTLLNRMKEGIDAAIGQLSYRLQRGPNAGFESDEWEYFAVVAGTEKQATPHVHIVVYCDGPVHQSEFEPVVKKFVEKCPDAPDSMRGNKPDDGAIKIYGLGNGEIPRVDDNPKESAASTYVLGQLPHLQSVGEMALDELLHSSTTDAWKGRAFRRSNYTVWDDDEEEAPQDVISEVDPTQSSADGLAAFV